MALFLTDDLLKSDKKRKKAPEVRVPALTSISERDEPMISLEQRLEDLEIVTNYHDTALRSLEAWSTTAFLMDPDTEQAPILIKALSTYNETRIESGRPFAKYHATLTNPEDLEHRSVNLLVARKTKKATNFHSAFAHTLQLCQRGTRHSRCSPTGSDNNRTAKSLYDATPPGTEARRIDSRALGRTNVKSFFFLLSETVGAPRQRCARA